MLHVQAKLGLHVGNAHTFCFDLTGVLADDVGLSLIPYSNYNTDITIQPDGHCSFVLINT